jgi:hypothetical protein
MARGFTENLSSSENGMRENTLLELPCFELQHALQPSEPAAALGARRRDAVESSRRVESESPEGEPTEFLY